ncbi:hypothetical protein ACWGM0_14180 [Sphingomonas bisphenolicum]
MDADVQRTSMGDIMWRGCLILLILPLVLMLGFCGWVRWESPRGALPPEVEWDEIIAFGEDFGLRDGCGFGAYHISPETSLRFVEGRDLPVGWYRTPLPMEDGQYAYVGPDRKRITLYAHHGTTCASKKGKRLGLPDRYQRALRGPGNWYRISNHGEGLIVVSPKEALAWYLYFG